MTQLLEQAFAQASKLPPKEQDGIAQTILEEMKMEQQWQTTLDNSESLLESLSNEALTEHQAGKTKDFDY